MKTITLKKTGYYVTGISDLTLWGNEPANIIMKPFHINDIKKSTLLKNINDNGFGCQSINGAICDINEDYEGTHRFLKTVIVGKISDDTFECYNYIM